MKKSFFLLLIYSNKALCETTQSSLSQETIGSYELVKVSFGLLMVLAFIFLLSYIVKRFNTFAITTNNFVKVISTTNLGGKERLLLVKAGENYLLLGVSAQSISKLYDYGDSLDFNEESLKNKNNFLTIFNKLTKNE